MLNKLPGQKGTISPELYDMFKKVETECNRKLKFSGVPRRDFIGRTEWQEDCILVEISSNLSAPMAEYIAAHELGHVLQFVRGCVIASGRLDEVGSVTIATMISDLILDPLADTFAIEHGLPMASYFESWLESESVLEILRHPRNGRRYGKNWPKVWEGISRARVCRRLGLEPPNPNKDYWTMYVALDLAKITQRARNLKLSVEKDVLKSVKKIRLLSDVINDLIDIGSANELEESAEKAQRILTYFKADPGHIFIHRPLTNEFLVEGQWQVQSYKDENEEEATWKNLLSSLDFSD